MAVINPVPPNHELCRRLVAALGLPFPVERLVIEIDAREHVRSYVKTPARVEDMGKIVEAFEYVACDELSVGDDTEVRYVETKLA
jgi:hypothetical protein